MTIKQKSIFWGIYIGFIVFNGTMIFLCHVPTYVVVFSALVSFIAGTYMGRLEHKWKRDKQMAGIVAERLMGKPKVTDGGFSNLSQSQMNSSGMGQLMNSNISNGYSQQNCNSLTGGFITNGVAENFQEGIYFILNADAKENNR